MTSSTSSVSQYTISYDSSMISAITLDDALCNSESFRFDPTLESLREQKWTTNPTGGNLEEEEDLRLPCKSLNRFSNALEGNAVDTALCAKPQRRPSLYKSLSSTSLKHHHLRRTSTCSSSVDYRSSKNFVAASFFLEEEILDFDDFDYYYDENETLERSEGF